MGTFLKILGIIGIVFSFLALVLLFAGSWFVFFAFYFAIPFVIFSYSVSLIVISKSITRKEEIREDIEARIYSVENRLYEIGEQNEKILELLKAVKDPENAEEINEKSQ